ncbi:MAG: futalosine hydrolase [Nitrospirae bacterium]|nr:futalosine hydrolase [Nitrospirota bacterium]
MSLIGIIASTDIEASLCINMMAEKEEFSIQNKPFYRGTLLNREVAICICGIGKTHAAHGITLLIERFKPGVVFNIGVAGAYPSSKLNIGDIAIAEKETYGDEGMMTEDSFHAINEIMKGAVPNEFIMHIPENLKGFKNRGNFVTVSTCTGTLKKGKELEQRFKALCENMEGAAVAQICSLAGVPSVEIRGISNIIEDRKAAPLLKSDVAAAAENVQSFLLDNVIPK